MIVEDCCKCFCQQLECSSYSIQCWYGQLLKWTVMLGVSAIDYSVPSHAALARHIAKLTTMKRAHTMLAGE